ncbi:MAG: hypothetical protein RJA07_669 [Bacteroidota bacterium]|jgi:hypothetical protein
MKKIFTLLFLVVGMLNSYAQPTINSSAFPIVGITYHHVAADANTVSNLSAMLTAGTNQTWNCRTTFTPLDTQHLNYVTAASTPYSNLFSTSSLSYNSTKDSIYTFLHTNANGLYLDGIYSYKAGLVSGDGHYANGGQLVLPTPFSITNTNVSPGVFTAIKTVLVVFKAGIYRTETRNSVADGWGTIITPSDTFTNVLRIKTKVTSYDSIFLPSIIGPSPAPTFDTSYEYSWVQNIDSIGQIMTITTAKDSTTINNANYNYNKRKSNANGIAELKQQNGFSLFPNPCSNSLNINFATADKYQIIISNILGNQIFKTEGNKQTLFIDTKDFLTGTYFLQVIQNGKTSAKKFVVNN